MARYHINPKNGNAGLCKALVSCPFGDMEEDHYDTKQAAQKAFESSMGIENHSALPTSATSYDFPAFKLDKALRSIEKANKKAEAAGIAERFTFTVERYEKSSVDSSGLTQIEERVKVDLDRPSLQHEGWTFAGTMSWDEESGLITRMVPGEELIQKPKAELCDVCKTTRHRIDTYIIQKDGEQKQVGSSCLKKFMGIKPAGLWMLDFEPEIRESDDDYFRTPGGNLAEMRKDSTEMLALGLAVTAQNGWVSRSVARDYDKIATADVVTDALAHGGTQEAIAARARLISESKKYIKEAEEVLAEARTIEGYSEYAENLRNLSSSDTVSMRNLPLLLSAIGQHQRIKKKKEEAKKKPVSEWVGMLGTKISDKKVTVEAIRVVTNSMGSSRIVTMRDENGDVLKSFYSGSGSIKEGEKYILTSATVKEHQEWNGQKETMLSRIKLETVRPTRKPPTTLPKSSPYWASWTVEENARTSASEMRRIKKEIKKKAGKNGWNPSRDLPLDSELLKEWDALERASKQQFHQRYREITGE